MKINLQSSIVYEIALAGYIPRRGEREQEIVDACKQTMPKANARLEFGGTA